MTYGPGQLVLVTAEPAGAAQGIIGWYVNAGALVVRVGDGRPTAPRDSVTPTHENA